ncbi:LuxR C-terminal-related transcriptional regulator [Pseudaquabacterium pictum]|uniref:Helix-turn-helix transcriptional regulator n=1 Tax=Pseudaquabacterium pictum TaxID=2315236 RepID=A0A480APY7_9BURK|nr:LuxR C-terminal-related transcriptional regulator [Rubrivivax pictus]GCL61735.1 helix-turn-helix transcriptional regulator [Rubrivivax pictus]
MPPPPPTLTLGGLPAGPLSSKLNPPLSQARQVLRQAVVRRMAEAGGVKLLLVRAPAGFGKTTAMVQAREQLAASGVATAWLTLERTDNDVPRFLACLQQAVAQIVGRTSLPGAQPGAGLGGPATPLVDALARHGAPFALFLDDFELITEPAVLGLVREIIDHLPRRGQLVLGSRSLPELGLGRLRMAGQLLEIDTELLRFSRDETRQFLALRWPGDGSGAPGDLAAQVDPLHAKTEGWVAALWLASMALDSVMARQGSVAGFIAQFSGSNRAVADFLAEDVLARQTPEVRDFLLRTSILRQFNAPLCQALTPRSDAARILAQLDAANLFITPISTPVSAPGAGSAPPEREWRYHSLFADFLRAQLAREQPDALARLHLAASGWYESQGRPVPAIDHAIEGGDAPHAVHLLAGQAMDFLQQGRMRLLARWFAALQNVEGGDALADQPMLQVVSLWASNLTRGPWAAMEQLQQSGCATSADAAVRAHVNALQPMLLAMMDRVEDAADLGREALARVPTGQPFADSVLCNVMAHVMGVLGEREQAQRLLDAARRGQQGDGFNRMYTESVEGLLDLQQGRLRQATARFRLALGMAAVPSATLNTAPWQPTHGNAWAGVLYAGVVYEAHQLAQAEHLLNVYLPLARDVGLPDHMILSHVMVARIAFDRGDIDAALQFVTELEHLGHHRQLPRVVASARLERARVLMLQGQAEAAALALDRADDAAVWQRVARHQFSAHDVEDMPIGRLRWQVLFGDPAAAARAAAAAAAQAQAAQRQRRALKLQLLQALALQRAGSPADLDAALQLTGRLLQVAQAEGYVRLLLDEGPAVGTLLRRTQAALHAAPGERVDPLVDDCLQRLIALAGDEPLPDEPAAAAEPAAPGAPLDEPLTRKEIRVLQLLAEGYSNSVMAEKLFVSDSTVRTHLRNINLKLGARSRTQAVAIARKLGVMT